MNLKSATKKSKLIEMAVTGKKKKEKKNWNGSNQVLSFSLRTNVFMNHSHVIISKRIWWIQYKCNKFHLQHKK